MKFRFEYPGRNLQIMTNELSPVTHEKTVSKSQRKRHMHELQLAGIQLTKLSPEQLDELALPDPLAAAVSEYRRLSAREAKRRQLQYIGKLMKTVDFELVRQELARFAEGSVWSLNLHHRTEAVRSALMGGDPGALTEFINEFPNADAQLLRQLIRHARKDAESQKTGVTARSSTAFCGK